LRHNWLCGGVGIDSHPGRNRVIKSDPDTTSVCDVVGLPLYLSFSNYTGSGSR
jgi:hypothetical protein